MQQTVFSPFQWAAPTSTSFESLAISHAGKKVRRNSYGKAKTLDAAELQRLLIAIQKTRPSPEADVVKVLLSFLAGLRACEISGLHISDVTKPDGSTSDIIRIRPNISKGGRGREVPMCAELKRATGGPAAAQRLRKQLRRLFEHGVRLGMIRTNPVELTARVRYKTGGHHTWTEGEIAAFRERHPLGTKPRLALEIILWTGQRRGDVHRFGPPHVRDGRINYEQEKGGKELWLPVATQLRAAIDAMPAIGVQTFLVTEYGKPFSKGGFGNWFRERCDEAGLKHCTAHGLRKAIARRLAENGATQKMIKSVGGWSNDREVAIYTAGADQAELARTALTALAEWEAQALGGPPTT